MILLTGLKQNRFILTGKCREADNSSEIQHKGFAAVRPDISSCLYALAGQGSYAIKNTETAQRIKKIVSEYGNRSNV